MIVRGTPFGFDSMHDDNNSDTTQILLELCNRQPDAAERLMPVVYDELKGLAVAAMRRERPDHTLQPTALVNEAFLRLIDQERVKWRGRAHFCAIAATMMRRILVNHARNRVAMKRGNGISRIPLHDELVAVDSASEVDVLDFDQLLTELAELNPRHANVIELRFFTGLSIAETAEVLDVSEWTIKNDWRVARVWLLMKLNSESKAENLHR